jgi:hypothetical protein
MPVDVETILTVTRATFAVRESLERGRAVDLPARARHRSVDA